MKPCFINSVGCVSTQNTLDNLQFLNKIATYNSNVIQIIKPDYKDYNIKGASARRMAKGVKMGVVASSIALKEAKIIKPDAIITGTGMGCTIDSEKFLSAIINNNEQFLTPTSFIQSTHNTVGAQIALGLQCNGYNFTYVNGAVSFESSLIDAQLMLDEEEAEYILAGGVDELAEHTTKLYQLINFIKNDTKINTYDILNSKTKGSVLGEGATFFVLSNQLKKNSYAKLIDTVIFSSTDISSINEKLINFLALNNKSISDIDVSVLGNNGDILFDEYYHILQNNSLKKTVQVAYKHLCGEHYSASAFGFWAGCKILKHQLIPEELILNDYKTKNISTVLLYNQYQGKNHSFILLEKC